MKTEVAVLFEDVDHAEAVCLLPDGRLGRHTWGTPLPGHGSRWDQPAAGFWVWRLTVRDGSTSVTLGSTRSSVSATAERWSWLPQGQLNVRCATRTRSPLT